MTELLERAAAASQAGDRAGALRLYDQAFRTFPDHSCWTAPVYGRLLAASGTDASVALAVLQEAERVAPSAEVAAALMTTWSRLGQHALAETSLEQALDQYALEGELRSAIIGALDAGALTTPGVVGFDRHQSLIVLIARAALTHLTLEVLGRPIARTRRRVAFDGPTAIIRVGLTPTERAGVIVGSVRGVPLIGSPRSGSIDPGLEGAVTGEGVRIHGRVRFAFAPAAPVEVRVRDEHGHTGRVATRAEPIGGVSFALGRRPRALRGARWTFEARLGGGAWQTLPDAPWLLNRAATRVPTDGTGRRAPRRAPDRAPVAIVVPVYRGLHETLACLESVAATQPVAVRLLVIDDASPEPGLSKAIEAWCEARHAELIRHPTNLGFAAAINTAARAAPGHDLLLLNSDTRVHGDWVERLQHAAYADPHTGTVTPWTDDATLTSLGVVPSGAARPVESFESLDAQVASEFTGETLDIPVGVGFCLYLRHDAWAATGSFDVAVFGPGYGEETDFCLRARRLGYRSVQALDVFVHHAGGGSFGARRAALLTRSARLVERRHPGYHARVAKHLKRDPLAVFRRRLDEARVRARDGRAVLFVSHGQGGGVRRHVEERRHTVRAGGQQTLLLEAMPERAGWVRLSVDEGDVLDLRYDAGSAVDRRRLIALLRDIALVRIEVHHTLGIPATLIEALRTLGVPYDVSLHDYLYLCPRVTLMGVGQRYCGEPPVRACAGCVKREGSALPEAISAPRLRARSARWLEGARRVLAPSRDVATRYRRHFPHLSVKVVPHAPSGGMTVPVTPRPADGRVRVALIGGIGDSKGYRVLLECARDAKRRRLPLEFVVVGHTQNDARLERTGRVFVTGRYLEGEAARLLAREAPHVVFMASVWPETWCYALDVALGSGLPILAFDLGAIAERLRAAKVGRLVALGTGSQLLNTELLKMAAGFSSTDAS